MGVWWESPKEVRILFSPPMNLISLGFSTYYPLPLRQFYPLPPVSEVFGLRLPPTKDCLTSVNFDLVPNQPPPGMNLWELDVEEEVTESESEEEMQGIEEPPKSRGPVAPPIMARNSPSDDVDMMGAPSDASEADDGDDGLFGIADGGDVGSDTEAIIEESQVQATQRTLVEDEEYD